MMMMMMMMAHDTRIVFVAVGACREKGKGINLD